MFRIDLALKRGFRSGRMGALRSVVAAATLLGGAGAACAAEVIVGLTAWPSAQVTGHIIGELAAEKFGDTPVFLERGSVGLLTAIAKGEADIYPELWSPNLDAAVQRVGGSLTISPRSVAGHQGICATSAAVRQTGIRSVADLTKPEIAAAFDTDDDGRGELWIGDGSWFSSNVERVRARSIGYDQTMQLLEGAEAVAMAAVDAGSALDRPVVFYCYSPHHVFVLHDIVVLEEPAYDAARWSIVAPADDKDWLAHSRAETGWDKSSLSIAFATRLTTERPELAEMLARMQFEPGDIAAMSYAVEVDGKSPEAAAEEWLAANRARVEGWFK
ncbi:MAG TPA: glycine betaine ABC transporter substrate-binding protein [Devosia sp.]|jgi:glycine betaine/proline transport system substrate-binding protein|uniref:ABC transporter substrate-binding protein n=1 Tax=Devosia sp. TaxID=1871048 RepID=UPI002DDD08F2|nr:glycine betaine ABC transporter substrate-binding protein [Devosia sp.]HEV2513834.1 glycine betaine ABC transporter substrate-binding protein [Devosia sp.]